MGSGRAVALISLVLLIAIGVGVGGEALFGSSNAGVSGPSGQPRSEILTFSISATGTSGPFHGRSLQREAITLTAEPSVKTLISEGQAFACSAGSAGPCQVTVDGVSYIKNSIGIWSAQKSPYSPGIFPSVYSPSAAVNSLKAFRRIVLGSVSEQGTADVGGIPTTEYRGDVSLVELYLHQQLGSLVGFVFTLGNPSPSTLPTLSRPIDVWADEKGQILQARASESEELPTGARAGSGQPKRALDTDSVTISLSDFGLAVHVSAPPRSDTTFRPSPKETLATGKVLVVGRGGQALTERGMLALAMTRQSPFSDHLEPPLYGLTSVGADGDYSASVIGEPEGTIRIQPYFYPDATTRLTCAVQTNDRFKTEATTTGVNFTCKSMG